jgi:tRNA-specific 2-thiouridylase
VTATDTHLDLPKVAPIADTKLKVVVAMSGGVDSSTVAAILADQGHEVIGVTLQLYDHGLALAKKGACCAGQDIYDAQMAAEKIGIPHYVLNYESIFKESVIDDFADSYLRGETPIPCVRCNQRVKFRDLFKVAQDLGAAALATGHYVRRLEVDGEVQLHQGADMSKDQSYFLFATTYDQLKYLRFPVGDLVKSETRRLAEYYGLEIADKPDSQDICFVPNGSYSNVIERFRPGALSNGDIVDKNGKVLGRHNGIINYTIGQRRGLGLASEDGEPLYVVKIDPDTHQVVVGHKEDLAQSAFMVKDFNWIGEKAPLPGEVIKCKVKLRSAHQPIVAEVLIEKEGTARVRLDDDYSGVTPGQACVLYNGSHVLGGGWITRKV